MVKRVTFYIFLIFIILTSCDDSSELAKKTIQVPPSLVHPLILDGGCRGLINFPFWFNDSIIHAQGIKEIDWIEYESFIAGEAIKEPIQPKTHFVFRFNDEGYISRYEQFDFDNGIRVSRQLYFLSSLNKMGYSRVKAARKIKNTLCKQPIYTPTKSNERLASYEHKPTMHQLHFLLNDYFHSPLSVDSIAHPTPHDWVILGRPEKPIKRYQVRNTVKERNITSYTYHNDNYPKRIVSDHYPFTRKSHFNYSKSGRFKGCTDTIFIEKTAVTIEKTNIIYDSLNRPIRIHFSKGHPDGSVQSKRNTLITYKSIYIL